ncbi:MAG: hypothetical protein WCN98_03525 [Verrucomicrobiaceae bacterium]
MTKIQRRAAISFLALTAAMLTSCLELYDEEMIIHTDLSGSVKATVKLPDTLLSKYDSLREEFTEGKVHSRFASLSGVKLTSYSITEGRFPVATFDVSFSSLQKLSDAVEANDPAQFLVGLFAVKKDDGKTVIERKLGHGKTGMEMPEDKYAIYKMHFDVPVEVVNTNSEYVDKSHNDVRYRWALSAIAAQQPLITNRLLKPLPWKAILIAVSLVGYGAWILSRYLSKRKVIVTLPRSEPGLAPKPQSPQRPGPPKRPDPPR